LMIENRTLRGDEKRSEPPVGNAPGRDLK